VRVGVTKAGEDRASQDDFTL